MSKPALARLAVSTASRGLNGAGQREGRNLADALDEHREQQHRREVQQEANKPASYVKTLHLHIGGDLQIPVRSNRFEHPSQRAETRQQQQEAAAARDPFDGLPLRAWAEKLGERVMPAYELIKEEHAAAKRAAKALGAKVPELHVPSIPHVLPFTRWAAQSKTMQSTFVVDESKPRKKARLSWYHPDDTMVPRDWFRGGLLKDLAYYRPFAAES